MPEWDLVAQRGAQGVQGPIGPTGPVGMDWEDTYATGTFYNVDDVVQFNGSSFIAVNAGYLPAPPAPSPDVTTVTGATGPTGPVGPQGTTGATGSQGPTGASAVLVGPMPSGDTSGVTDRTNIVNAANAVAAGSTLSMSRGVYYVDNLHVPNQVVLDFGGWTWLRDALGAFGSAGWTNAANYSGGVLHVTTTSGAGVLIDSAATTTGGLRNVLIIGPGSGTGIGLDLGNAAHAIVDGQFLGIGIGNFAIGLRTRNVEESDLKVSVLGCTTGATLQVATNNNHWRLFQAQKCVAGLVIDASCIANQFDAPLFQGNTGLSADLGGLANVLDDPYFENVAGTGAAIIRNSSKINNPTFQTAADTLLIPSLNPGVILDPLGLMFCTTHLDPATNTVLVPNSVAADAIYSRIYGAATIGHVLMQVQTAGALIDVGVYTFAPGFGGRGRQPGAKKATTGSIPCPAVGNASIVLPSAVTAMDGDFFAVACSDTVSGFSAGSNATLGTGFPISGARHLRQATAFPLPATAAAVPCVGQDWIMVGDA